MKKFISWLMMAILAAITLLGITACRKEEEKQDWEEDGVLKILTIGNSFSVDTTTYLHEVAESAGVKDYVIYNMAIGGCTLDLHYEYITNNKSNYELFDYSTGEEVHSYNNSPRAIIKAHNWDFISLQQQSMNSGVKESFSKLQALVNHIRTLANLDAKFVWNMTWAYQSNYGDSAFETFDKDQVKMYNAIVDCVQSEIITKPEFEIVVPNGTAIQNARTSYLGDTLTRDGYHLNYRYGRYIAALTFFHKVTGIDISELAYAPTGVVGNPKLKAMCIESAINAVKNPYEVTQSEYIE